jgi:hypothetical protein
MPHSLTLFYLKICSILKSNSLLLKRLLSILTVLVWVCGCTTSKTDSKCGLDPNNFPKQGQDSKVISFKRTAVLDTITVVIIGQITSITNNDTLPLGNIELINGAHSYKTTSDLNGQFTFHHIEAGTYKLAATYIGFRALKADSLHFESGDIVDITIGLGCLGQDDLK